MTTILIMMMQQNILEIKLSRISKTRLDLECSSSAFNKHVPCKNPTQQRQNREDFVLWQSFSRHLCWLEAGLVHPRSDLVFEKPKLPNIILFSECLFIRVQPWEIKYRTCFLAHPLLHRYRPKRISPFGPHSWLIKAYYIHFLLKYLSLVWSRACQWRRSHPLHHYSCAVT